MKRLRVDGFTLIEIAIAVVVIALLLGSLLGPLSVRIEQADRQKTQAMLDETKEALYGFALANGRLPCPDTDGDGSENRTGGVCTGGVVVGNLPWVDLAVPELDAWGRRFRYRVTPSYADAISQNTVAPPPPPGLPTPPCTTTPAQASFALCSDGDITIRDGDATILGTTEITTEVAAVVISHGKHRFLPADASPHEDENFDDSSIAGDTLRTFVSRDYTGGTGEEFDDLVVWISPLILKNRMIMAGKLP
ncbi:MAG: type II secretion system protein [Chromatiales bacterium]